VLERLPLLLSALRSVVAMRCTSELTSLKHSNFPARQKQKGPLSSGTSDLVGKKTKHVPMAVRVNVQLRIKTNANVAWSWDTDGSVGGTGWWVPFVSHPSNVLSCADFGARVLYMRICLDAHTQLSHPRSLIPILPI
jgi:hypothetical protein